MEPDASCHSARLAAITQNVRHPYNALLKISLQQDISNFLVLKRQLV